MGKKLRNGIAAIAALAALASAEPPLQVRPRAGIRRPRPPRSIGRGRGR